MAFSMPRNPNVFAHLLDTARVMEEKGFQALCEPPSYRETANRIVETGL